MYKFSENCMFIRNILLTNYGHYDLIMFAANLLSFTRANFVHSIHHFEKITVTKWPEFKN